MRYPIISRIEQTLRITAAPTTMIGAENSWTITHPMKWVGNRPVTNRLQLAPKLGLVSERIVRRDYPMPAQPDLARKASEVKRNCRHLINAWAMTSPAMIEGVRSH